MKKGASAVASVRGDSAHHYNLHFVRFEPYVIPKKNLTGDSTERVDTRVLQVIYSMTNDGRVYVGQQMDVFIDARADAGSAGPSHGRAALTTKVQSLRLSRPVSTCPASR